jgi:hypothetical protein
MYLMGQLGTVPRGGAWRPVPQRGTGARVYRSVGRSRRLTLGQSAGSLTDQQILTQIGAPQSIATFLLQQMASESLSPDPSTLNCGGVSQLATTLTSTAAGIAVKIAPLTGPAAPFVLAGAAIAKLFSSIFLAHHAQAVAKERSILCALVPAANSTLQAVEQAVQSGQLSPQDAITALNGLVSDFSAQVVPIIKNCGPGSRGNAACGWGWAVKAVVAKKTNRYQSMAIPAAGTAAAGVPSGTGPLGLPPWAWLAAAAVVLYKVV